MEEGINVTASEKQCHPRTANGYSQELHNGQVKTGYRRPPGDTMLSRSKPAFRIVHRCESTARA